MCVYKQNLPFRIFGQPNIFAQIYSVLPNEFSSLFWTLNFPRKMFVVEQVLGISILVENIDIVNRKQIFIVVT